MKFAERVKELRVEKKLTQRDVGEIFKVHHTTINDWERGKSQTSFEMLLIIANFFGVSTDYLLGKTNDY